MNMELCTRREHTCMHTHTQRNSIRVRGKQWFSEEAVFSLHSQTYVPIEIAATHTLGPQFFNGQCQQIRKGG